MIEDEKDRAGERALLWKALHGDMKAIRFWLSNREPELWQERRKVVNDNEAMLKWGEEVIATIRKTAQEWHVEE